MHLMFAVILLFLSAGFIVRATHGKYNAVEEVGFLHVKSENRP